jgi:hypothetical protein
MYQIYELITSRIVTEDANRAKLEGVFRNIDQSNPT